MTETMPPVQASWKNYLSITRPGHWFKNIFMLPGVGLAYLAAPPDSLTLIMADAVLGLISVILVVSANYTLNEYLDAKFDIHHELKKNRPTAVGLIDGRMLALQYSLLSISGLLAGFQVNTMFGVTAMVLLAMGVLYNVSPVRLKDLPYLDVISESFNNPLRFVLGWSIITTEIVPPSSILLAYWLGGAFLMAVKRFSEYRFIGDAETAAKYRSSFHHYGEEKLIVSSLFYAVSTAFFLATFLLKHRIELILTFPLFAILFSWYMHMAFKQDAATQRPEKLHRETGFMLFLAFLVATVIGLFVVEIPQLHFLLT